MTNTQTLQELVITAITLRQQELLAKQGPTLQEYESLQAIGDLLANKGDQLLFRGKDTAELFNQTAWAVAVLSFLPGGVDFMGRNFKTSLAINLS